MMSWASEKAGVKKCHLALKITIKPVFDGRFGHYLHCRRWVRTGGCYWLTIVPQVKVVENELPFERLRVAKYCNTFTDLMTSAEKMEVKIILGGFGFRKISEELKAH